MSTSAAALMTGCGARGQFTAVVPGEAFERRSILMATNRADPASTERSETLNFYDLEIAVPRNRSPGDVPLEGDNAFALSKQRQISTDQDLKRVLGPSRGDPLVIWVHGFNSTSAEAVYRQAQMATDTGLRGPQLAFVWPSAATARGYLFDRDSALQARSSLEALFVRLGRIWSGQVTVIAHSLGCLLAMEALVRMRLQDRPVVLDSLVLLQPDISPDVFQSQVADISPLPKNALLVTSQDDPALRFSAFASQSRNRVGATRDSGAYEDLGFRVVDLTGIPDAGNPHLVALTSPTVLEFLRETNDR
jgi:esterase/lipase superfamily enzyme